MAIDINISCLLVDTCAAESSLLAPSPNGGFLEGAGQSHTAFFSRPLRPWGALFQKPNLQGGITAGWPAGFLKSPIEDQPSRDMDVDLGLLATNPVHDRLTVIHGTKCDCEGPCF